MNNRTDMVLPQEPQLALSEHTKVRFQAWLAQALGQLAIPPATLMPRQTALVTLTAHESVGQPLTARAISTTTELAERFPDTTCTLCWHQEHWVLSSLSNLTRIEESHPPCCEHLLWFGQTPGGYRLSWAPMPPAEAQTALHTWELLLSSVPALAIHISLELDGQEHGITLYEYP